MPAAMVTQASGPSNNTMSGVRRSTAIASKTMAVMTTDSASIANLCLLVPVMVRHPNG